MTGCEISHTNTGAITPDWRGPVRESLDVFAARWAVVRLGAAIGFPTIACQELAIAVSELATNILKYGIRGEIHLCRVDDPDAGPGLAIVAEDEGPPLADLEVAIRDGWDDRQRIDPSHLGRRGLGAGLGAVSRLTDRLEYHPGAPIKAFRAVRYLRRPRRAR